MAREYADRVQETTTTTGIGTYSLAGAITGYQGFIAGTSTGAEVSYCCIDGTNWEVGVGILTDAAPDTLTRATVLDSSNAGSAVNWGAGTKQIFLVNAASGVLKSDVTKLLTAGYSTTPHNAGTKASGTFTPDEADGNFQYAVNGGAHTLAPPTLNSTIVIQYTNNASAGAITVSGFTQTDGDAFTTTDGHDFMCYITKNNGFSLLTVKALQ